MPNRLLQKITDRLTKKQVLDFEIYLQSSSSLTLQAKKKKMEVVETNHQAGFDLRILHNDAMGYAYGGDFSAVAVDKAIKNAVDGAAFLPSDASFPWNGKSVPAVTIHDSSLTQRSMEEKIAALKRMEEAAFRQDRRVHTVEDISYSEALEEIHILRSDGFNASFERTELGMGLTVLAKARGDIQSAYDMAHATFWDDLSPEDLGARAARHAAGLLGVGRLPNYHGPVVIHPKVGVEMLEVIAESALFENVHKENSFFKGKMGQALYSPKVTLIDDALYPHGVATRPFDAEGTPSQKITVMQGGILRHYLYDNYWAHKDGTQSTGHAVKDNVFDLPALGTSNFYMEPRATSLEGIFRSIGNGLMITEALGMHTADPVSGDLSVGVQGYVLQNGQLAYPFRSMVLTGNLHQLFKDISLVADDLSFYGPVGAPSFVVEGADIAGEYLTRGQAPELHP